MSARPFSRNILGLVCNGVGFWCRSGPAPTVFAGLASNKFVGELPKPIVGPGAPVPSEPPWGVRRKDGGRRGSRISFYGLLDYLAVRCEFSHHPFEETVFGLYLLESPRLAHLEATELGP